MKDLLTEVNKILIVRLSSFGDIVLTFPLLNIIKSKYPESQITFLVRDKYADLVGLNTNIDEVIIFNDGEENNIRRTIQVNSFDAILDLQNNVRSRVMTRGLPNVFRFRKNNFQKFLLVKFKINLLKDSEPVYRRYIETAATPLGISDNEIMFSTGSLNTDRSNIAGSYIVLAPSSRHFTKTYPKEKFVEYINSNSDSKFVLVGDKSETDIGICTYIEENTTNTENLCGQLSYGKLSGIIAGSEHVICNDSGILHLSEALGKRVMSIFGSTVKEFGFFPQLNSSVVYEVNGLKCRPCSHIGLSECPLGHFKCMMEVNLD